MCTEYPEIFAALAAPFHPDNVKQKMGYDYITARTVMNRLDDVVGPENWWDDYTLVEHGAICRLTIRLPDGQLLTKVDIGADSTTLKDAGDADKGGMSDAFKRAAVKFGVFRYGYKDGVVTFAAPAPAAIPAAPAPAAPAPAEAKPKKAAQIKTGRQLYRFAANCRIDRDLIRWMLATFTQFDVKIANWSQAQVAYALPEIRKHLEEMLAANKEHAA